MGTRSLTVLKDGDTEITVLYQQFDGYPEGVGKEIAEFLGDKRIVNGFNSTNADTSFNGPGCLAASLVANFKQGIGGAYLHPAGTRDCGEDYIYEVRASYDNPEITMACFEVGYRQPAKEVFAGTPKQFMEWLVQREAANAEEE